MMVLCTVTLTTSCGGDDDDDDATAVSTSQIVGVWRDIDTSDGNEDWTFNSNGTGNLHFEYKVVSGYEQIDFTYTYSNNKLTITSVTVEGNTTKGNQTYDVLISSDGTLMYMSGISDDDDAIVLRRIK